jgi:hypothetical protein
VTVTARRVRKEQLRSGKAVRTGVTWREFDMQRKTDGEVTGPGGPSGIESTRPRMRARVFYQWSTRLVSAGTCICKATNYAQASWRPMVWKQNGSSDLESGCASMPIVHAPEQSGQRGFLLVRVELFGRPGFGIACA